MEKEQTLKNIKRLFIGKKTLKQRFSTAFWPSFGLSFLLFFFGPLDLSINAETSVNYKAIDVLPTCLKTFAFVFIALFLISWLPGGKLHAWLSSLFCGLQISFYIQGNFLNPDLGVLDGTAVDWQDFGDNALISLLFFSLITVFPFILHFISRKKWRVFLVFSSILLIIMQAVPLGITLFRENKEAAKDNYYLQTDREYVLGEKNIVVFILDFTSPISISGMLNSYPDALSAFHDFEYFNNYSTEHFGTFPSVTTLLTHQAYDHEIPYDDWYYRSWHSDDAKNFYGIMQENGWSTRIFNNVKIAAGYYENEYGLIDNIQKIEYKSPIKINSYAFRKLIKLSFFRYFPLIMKAPFWIYTGDLNSMIVPSGERGGWDPIQSLQRLLSDGISVDDEEKVYIMYHYQGGHLPYTLKRDGTPSRSKTDQATQLAGQFFAIEQYLQHMKSLHIYDSSTIIITSDHGDSNDLNSILFIKPADQRQDVMTVSHAPITQMEFLPTIAHFAGLDSKDFGETYYDIPENEERLRCTEMRHKSKDYPRVKMKNFNAIRKYCFIGNGETLQKMIEQGDYEIIYAPYSWY